MSVYHYQQKIGHILQSENSFDSWLERIGSAKLTVRTNRFIWMNGSLLFVHIRLKSSARDVEDTSTRTIKQCSYVTSTLLYCHLYHPVLNASYEEVYEGSTHIQVLCSIICTILSVRLLFVLVVSCLMFFVLLSDIYKGHELKWCNSAFSDIDCISSCWLIEHWKGFQKPFMLLTML